MKRKALILSAIVSLVVFSSWGPEGHSTTAQVAENHLTANAKNAVSALLGTQSMASVSSWADQYRLTDTSTGKWHFLNLEIGWDYQRFATYTKNLATPNIYSELIRLQKEVVNPATSQAQKIKDLKFIIHFVGDAHQPMHVSRAEDRGGNWDTVTYKNHRTNLHSVWDGQLIRDDQPDYRQLAIKIDHVTPQQIQQWQSDDILIWLWESYQISSKLYEEAPNHTVLPADYYSTHIAIVEERLEKGGIRLAGLLNSLFH